MATQFEDPYVSKALNLAIAKAEKQKNLGKLPKPELNNPYSVKEASGDVVGMSALSGAALLEGLGNIVPSAYNFLSQTAPKAIESILPFDIPGPKGLPPSDYFNMIEPTKKYVEDNLYSNNLIGQQQNVAEGSQARRDSEYQRANENIKESNNDAIGYLKTQLQNAKLAGQDLIDNPLATTALVGENVGHLFGPGLAAKGLKYIGKPSTKVSTKADKNQLAELGAATYTASAEGGGAANQVENIHKESLQDFFANTSPKYNDLVNLGVAPDRAISLLKELPEVQERLKQEGLDDASLASTKADAAAKAGLVAAGITRVLGTGKAEAKGFKERSMVKEIPAQTIEEGMQGASSSIISEATAEDAGYSSAKPFVDLGGDVVTEAVAGAGTTIATNPLKTIKEVTSPIKKVNDKLKANDVANKISEEYKKVNGTEPTKEQKEVFKATGEVRVTLENTLNKEVKDLLSNPNSLVDKGTIEDVIESLDVRTRSTLKDISEANNKPIEQSLREILSIPLGNKKEAPNASNESSNTTEEVETEKEDLLKQARDSVTFTDDINTNVNNIRDSLDIEDPNQKVSLINEQMDNIKNKISEIAESNLSEEEKKTQIQEQGKLFEYAKNERNALKTSIDANIKAEVKDNYKNIKAKDTSSVDKLSKFIMGNEEDITPEVEEKAKALIADKEIDERFKRGLQFALDMRKTLKENKEGAKSLDQVSNDIYTEGYSELDKPSLKEYLESSYEGIISNDTDKVINNISNLTKFLKSHQTKLKTINAALAEAALETEEGTNKLLEPLTIRYGNKDSATLSIEYADFKNGNLYKTIEKEEKAIRGALDVIYNGAKVLDENIKPNTPLKEVGTIFKDREKRTGGISTKKGRNKNANTFRKDIIPFKKLLDNKVDTETTVPIKNEINDLISKYIDDITEYVNTGSVSYKDIEQLQRKIQNKLSKLKDKKNINTSTNNNATSRKEAVAVVSKFQSSVIAYMDRNGLFKNNKFPELGKLTGGLTASLKSYITGYNKDKTPTKIKNPSIIFNNMELVKKELAKITSDPANKLPSFAFYNNTGSNYIANDGNIIEVGDTVYFRKKVKVNGKITYQDFPYKVTGLTKLNDGNTAITYDSPKDVNNLEKGYTSITRKVKEISRVEKTNPITETINIGDTTFTVHTVDRASINNVYGLHNSDLNTIYVAKDISKDEFVNYVTALDPNNLNKASKQKSVLTEMFKEEGIDLPGTLSLFNEEEIKDFIVSHELSHLVNKDKDNYQSDKKQTIATKYKANDKDNSLLSDSALNIEKRATLDVFNAIGVTPVKLEGNTSTVSESEIKIGDTISYGKSNLEGIVSTIRDGKVFLFKKGTKIEGKRGILLKNVKLVSKAEKEPVIKAQETRSTNAPSDSTLKKESLETPKNSRKDELKQNINNKLGDLADLISGFTRSNMMEPEQKKAIKDILVPLMADLIELGVLSFKEVSIEVYKGLKDKLPKGVKVEEVINHSDLAGNYIIATNGSTAEGITPPNKLWDSNNSIEEILKEVYPSQTKEEKKDLIESFEIVTEEDVVDEINNTEQEEQAEEVVVKSELTLEQIKAMLLEEITDTLSIGRELLKLDANTLTDAHRIALGNHVQAAELAQFKVNSDGILDEENIKLFNNAAIGIDTFKLEYSNARLIPFGLNLKDKPLNDSVVAQDLLALTVMKPATEKGKKLVEEFLNSLRSKKANKEQVDFKQVAKDILDLFGNPEVGYPTIRDIVISQSVNNPRSLSKSDLYSTIANNSPVRDDLDKLKSASRTFINKRKIPKGLLAQIPNLLRRVLNPLFKEQIIDQANITEDTYNILYNFAKQVKVISDGIQETVGNVKKKKGYHYLDNPLTLLLNSDGKLPSVISDAMAISTLSWLVTDGKYSGTNFDTEINKILNRDSKETITPEAAALLRTVGKPLPQLINRLGNLVTNSINLGVINDAPEMYKEKLSASIGEQIIVALSSSGILKTTSYTQRLLNEIRTENEIRQIGNLDADLKFVKLNLVEVESNDSGENITYQVPTEQAKVLMDIYEKNNLLIDSLLGIDKDILDVSEEPVEKVKTRVGKIGLTSTPKAFAENIKSGQSKGFKINKDMGQLFFALGKDTFLLAAGFKTDAEIEKVPFDQKEGVIANNRQLEQQYEHLKNYMESNKTNLDKLMYFTYNTWSNFRNGIANNTINYQTSKLQRFMLSGSNWETNIEMGKGDTLLLFKSAVAQLLDYPVDKNRLEKSHEYFAEIENNKLFNDAADIIIRIQNISNDTEATLSSEEKALIVKATHKGEENIGSLAALSAYARYKYAKDNNEKSFTTELGKEIDGVTNGMSNILFEFAPFTEKYKKLMNAVGFYFKGDTFNSYLNWKEIPGNRDLYQAMAVAITKSLSTVETQMKELVGAEKKEVERSKISPLRAFSQFTPKAKREQVSNQYTEEIVNRKLRNLSLIVGSLVESDGSITSEARQFAKDPLMTYGYNAGMVAIARAKSALVYEDLQKKVVSMAIEYNSLVESGQTEEAIPLAKQIRDLVIAVEDISTGLPVSNEQLDNISKNIKVDGKSLFVKPDEFYSDILELKNKPNKFGRTYRATNIRNSVEAVYGAAMEFAFENEYEEVSNAKKILVGTMSALNHIFKANERRLFSEYKKKHGSLNQKAISEIHQDMLKKGHMVTVKTPLSESHEDSALIANQVSRNKNDTKAKVHLGNNKFKYQQFDVDNEGNIIELTKETSSLSSSLNTMEFSDSIGVKSIVILNILYDAFVLNPTMGKHNIMDIFDAKLDGIGNSLNSTETMNTLNSENHQKWNIVDAVNDTLSRFEEIISKDKNIYNIANDAYMNEQVNMGITSPASIKDTFADFSSMREMVNENLKLKHNNLIVSDQFPQTDKTAARFTSKTTEEDIINEVKNNNQDKQGSEATGVFNPDDFTHADKYDITYDTVSDIFDDLTNVGNVHESYEHKKNLKDVINGLIKPAMDSLSKISLKITEVNISRNKGYSGPNDDIYMYTSDQGKLNISNTEMSSQEVYVHEMLHNIWRVGISNNLKIQNKLEYLLQKAKQHTQPIDLLKKDSNGNVIIPIGSSYAEEMVKAKKRYNYIFNNKKTLGHLHEFGTIALSNETFMNHLKSIDASRDKVKSGSTLYSKVRAMFLNIINWISDLINKNANKNVHQAIYDLASNTTKINKAAEGRIAAYLYYQDKFNTTIRDYLNRFAWQPYSKAAEKFILSNGKFRHNKYVNIAITPLALPFYITSDAFKKEFNKVMYKSGWTKDNPIYKLIYEISGGKVKDVPIFDLARAVKQHVESQREHIRNIFTSQITNAFDQTNPLEEDSWLKLTNGLLKTDISSIFDPNNKAQANRIIKLLKNPHIVKADIRTIQNKIKSKYKANSLLIIQQAESLGHFMAQGTVGLEMQLLNAHKIGILHNGQPIQELEDLIDELATLESLRFTDKSILDDTADIMNHEYARDIEEGAENGVQMLLNFHTMFKKDALERNFGNKKHGMIKGYTKENFASHIDYQIASLSEEDNMRKAGYIKKAKLPRAVGDSNMGSPSMYIYVSRDGLLNPYMNGIFTLHNTRSKGTNIVENNLNNSVDNVGQTSREDLNRLTKMGIASLRKQAKQRVIDYDKTYMIPNFDNNDNLTSFRYIMSEKNKVDLLGKRDLANKTLGNMFGAILEKERGIDYNEKALKLLKEDFDKYYSNEPHEYVTIKKGMPQYDMLPALTRNQIQKIWGTSTIKVRQDIFDTVFGFRKLSLVDGMDTWLKGKSKSGTGINPTAKRIGHISGKLWQMVVARAKNVTVILTPAVVIANNLSNVVLLATRGVPPHKVLPYMYEGIQALNTYNSLRDKRDQLANRLESNPKIANRKALEIRLAQLNSRIEINPVTPLLDKGVFQSIADDISPDTEKLEELLNITFENANLIRKKLDKNINPKVKETIVGGYKQVTLSPDTEVGSFLEKVTQYSDFIARYALIKHLTETNKVNQDEAVKDALETFVDFNTLTSPQLQWINDNGILMYTKFFFRIQRVIAKAFIRDPGNVLAIGLTQQAFMDVPDIVESNFITNNIIKRLDGPIDTVNDRISEAVGFHAFNWVPGM